MLVLRIGVDASPLIHIGIRSMGLADREDIHNRFYGSHRPRPGRNRRHKADLGTGLPLNESLIRSKKEGAVLLDRAAEGSAELVQSQRRNDRSIKRRASIG